jgi:hypothetical protein
MGKRMFRVKQALDYPEIPSSLRLSVRVEHMTAAESSNVHPNRALLGTATLIVYGMFTCNQRVTRARHGR